jgi:hypothetical protein
MESEETTDGHVSKFIAPLGLMGWLERRETVGLVWVLGADVFGTRQECRGSESLPGENGDILGENGDILAK